MRCRTDRRSEKRERTSEEAEAVGKQHDPAAAQEEQPGMRGVWEPRGVAETHLGLAESH